MIKKRVQQTNETFQLYNDTIDHHQDKGTNGDWRSIKWLSLGFTVYKKLKEKAHPYALYDINQESNTHASSTLIQHSIQNVKEDREKTLSTQGLYLLSCGALYDEEQEWHNYFI